MDEKNILKLMTKVREGTASERKWKDLRDALKEADFPSELRDEAQQMVESHFSEKKEKKEAQEQQKKEKDKWEKQKKLEKMDEIFGGDTSFHNPYTFIPFPENPPERHKPTLLTADEIEKDRRSGVISVTIKNLSPLLTSQASPKDAPKHHPVLKIGQDVIVPASSVRGCLRNLMSIISGGTLSYLDEDLYLCQGRDLPLGGVLKGVQARLYLAKVTSAGNSCRDGKIVFGEAKLIDQEKLKKLQCGFEELENAATNGTGQGKELWIDDPADPREWTSEETEECSWLVKISGKKVPGKSGSILREGAFQPSKGTEITLPGPLWGAYQGRNRNSVRPELKKDDIIWLEPKIKGGTIRTENDVQSIQWARWGRSGQKLSAAIPKGFKPDSVNTDGLVDTVTDLFGSVSMTGKYPSFAARVVPENLVFQNAASSVFMNQMPPLSSPHPGCYPFYMRPKDQKINNVEDIDFYENLSVSDLPRGYKVYRTVIESDHPWEYAVQPVFDRGTPKDFNSCRNVFSADLLPKGKEGSLQISFRGLQQEELALLLLALTCDLRLGGGKPLGLGHCIAEKIAVIDETGEKILDFKPERCCLPDGYAVKDAILERAKIYCKTQEPVRKLRYPRCFKEDQKGGMCWFSIYAQPKKGTRSQNNSGKAAAGGVKEIYYRNQEWPPMLLPVFDPSNPQSDLLFGYDSNPEFEEQSGRNVIIAFRKETQSPSPKGQNLSQNRDTRQKERNER